MTLLKYQTEEPLFLGFDLSTQQLKVIVTNSQLKHIDSFHVEFDDKFGTKYGVTKGVYSNERTGEIVSPVAMWLESIDYVFDLMRQAAFPFAWVKGVSGSGQQHGSVYWSTLAPDALHKLCQKKCLEKIGSLIDVLTESTFSLQTSPNWQDHSTGAEIEAFERAVGGTENLAARTGSRAHYRFTGLQIRKICKTRPRVYQNTSRISLVSSFVASVLLGRISNIEKADGCGMNLYDIRKDAYDTELLSLAAGVHAIEDNIDNEELCLKAVEELKSKLGPLDPISPALSGSICLYFRDKYGFSESAQVYPFTGDNLATILSLPLNPKDILVSLGTSTTVLLVTDRFVPSSQYHMFKHPTMPNHYMGMICYCNGSLAREKVRDAVNAKHKVANDSWDMFDQILDQSDHFDHRLGIYFPLGEIVPNASAQTKRGILEDGEVRIIGHWDVDQDVSSIVESQALSCRVRLGPMLVSDLEVSKNDSVDPSLKQAYSDLVSKFGEIDTDGKKQTLESLTLRPRKVYFVGGALHNMSIVRKMGSILGSTDGNYKVDIPNSCALGGAFKASWGFECGVTRKTIDYNDYISDRFEFSDLEAIDIEDRWGDYFDGVGMLAKMEQELRLG